MYRNTGSLYDFLHNITILSHIKNRLPTFILCQATNAVIIRLDRIRMFNISFGYGTFECHNRQGSIIA